MIEPGLYRIKLETSDPWFVVLNNRLLQIEMDCPCFYLNGTEVDPDPDDGPRKKIQPQDLVLAYMEYFERL